MNIQKINEDNNYEIYLINPNESSTYHFPYILCIPKIICENDSIVLESNNQEDETKIMDSSIKTANRLMHIMNGGQNHAPIIVPLIPTVKGGIPYFQQLSNECFGKDLTKEYRRIDFQVLNIIKEARSIIHANSGIMIREKIFLNGYSASGVFAQRFALLHPNIIDAVCIGGAIGSLPVPLDKYEGLELNYPLGINNIEKLTGIPFNEEAYKKIKFRYYVAELESERKSDRRYDELGNPAPLHDMSYLERSVPSEEGKRFRKCFGINIFERFNIEKELYLRLGYDIFTNSPYKGKLHNNLGSDAFPFIDSCYKESTNIRNISL